MNGLMVGEGDRVLNASVHSGSGGYCLRLDLQKLDGTQTWQTFSGNESMLSLDLSLMKGQFIKSVALVDCTDLRITFSNESGIQAPLLIK